MNSNRETKGKKGKKERKQQMPRTPKCQPEYTDSQLREILEEHKSRKKEAADQERFAEVRSELMTSPEWEDYPCRYCDKENGEDCDQICALWLSWFKLHWRQIHHEGERIALAVEERKYRESLEKKHQDMKDLYANLSGGKSMLGI